MESYNTDEYFFMLIDSAIEQVYNTKDIFMMQVVRLNDVC
jgi:hypothetical protein